MASQTQQTLHFLLIPLMSQSHLIPFMDMVKVLSRQGIAVTIVLTPLNAARFNNVAKHAKASNLKIKFLPLPFPCQEAGLPEGCENLDALPTPSLIFQFFQATHILQDPLEKWLEDLEQTLRPNCIIADVSLPWTSQVASKFKIPKIVFNTTSCFTSSCSHNIYSSKVLEIVTSKSEPFLVPNIPNTIEFTKDELPQLKEHSSNMLSKDLMDKLRGAEISAQGILVNTFQELEPIYMKEYEKLVNKVWCIGPLFLFNRSVLNSEEEPQTQFLMSWLNYKACGSVIYVCFGSLCHMLYLQLVELAMGLEASGHPFIWVISKQSWSRELDQWLAQESFEERIKGKGLLVRGWAPQEMILMHPAIGGFLTHCGWSSTLEGVSAGLPMMTWPMFAEQFFNDKFIVQVLEIGVRVGESSKVEKGEEVLLVRKEDIMKVTEKMMDGGEEGRRRRNRAREMGKMAQRAVEEGGSSYLNWKLFIQYVMELNCHQEG